LYQINRLIFSNAIRGEQTTKMAEFRWHVKLLLAVQLITCFWIASTNTFRVARKSTNDDFLNPIVKRLKRYELIRTVHDPLQQSGNTLFFYHTQHLLVGELKAYDQVWKFYAFRLPVHRTRVFKNGRRLRTNAKHFQGRLYSNRDSVVMLYMLGNKLYGNIRHEEEIVILERWSTGRSVNHDSHILMYRYRDLDDYVDKPTFTRSEPMFVPPSAFSNLSIFEQIDRFAREDDNDKQVAQMYTCKISIVVDTFHAKLLGNDPEYVADELRLLVLMLNRIYEPQQFGSKYITFRTNRIDIITESSANEDDQKLLNAPNVAEKLLEQFSYRLNDECLSLLVTSRIIRGSTGNPLLGLAYVGKTHFTGVCSRPALLGGAEMRMLNTGFITSVCENGVLSRGEQALTLAHEVGHLFGSDHDTDAKDCGQNYLMGAHSSDASSVKSRTFSKCSIDLITSALQVPRECLTPVENVCGNGYREPGEECDCGTERMCRLLDNCCQANTCTLTPGCEPASPSKSLAPLLLRFA
jgi:hypothetical protein